jgi:hypothetical protein
LTITVAALAMLPAIAQGQNVFSAVGDFATIEASRDAFRVAVGGGTTAVGGTGNSLFVDANGARREINWDAVPDSLSSPNAFPADFFNQVSPGARARGALFRTPGTGFEVSARSGIAPIQFDNINPGYSANFSDFSPQRLFTAIGSNIVDVDFFKAGDPTQIGVVSAFGVIFSDVDLANTTSIEYFDLQGNSLGTYYAPAQVGDETFSFLGVQFGDAVVRRVRITNGNSPLGASINDQDGNPIDLVVMDDFLYSEPQTVPEPGSVALLTGMAVLSAGLIRRRSKRK